jgi:hypothetical protein
VKLAFIIESGNGKISTSSINKYLYFRLQLLTVTVGKLAMVELFLPCYVPQEAD